MMFPNFNKALKELDTAYKTAYKRYTDTLNKLNADYNGIPPKDAINANLSTWRDEIAVMVSRFNTSLDKEYCRLNTEIDRKYNVANTDTDTMNAIGAYQAMIDLATDKELLKMVNDTTSLEPYQVRILERAASDRNFPELRMSLVKFSRAKQDEQTTLDSHYNAYKTISGIKRISEPSESNYKYICGLHEQAENLGM